MKKYNNDSPKLSDWTTKKLKQVALELDEQIYGEFPCYGTSDIRFLDGVLAELDERGITISKKLSFE